MPDLSCPQGDNGTGAFRLSWEGAGGATFRLSEGGDVVYEGKDLATTLTGRYAGQYSYELVEVGGGSARCDVRVAPPSLGAAFAVLLVGAVVFLATLAVVLRGHRAHRAGRIG